MCRSRRKAWNKYAGLHCFAISNVQKASTFKQKNEIADASFASNVAEIAEGSAAWSGAYAATKLHLMPQNPKHFKELMEKYITEMKGHCKMEGPSASQRGACGEANGREKPLRELVANLRELVAFVKETQFNPRVAIISSIS